MRPSTHLQIWMMNLVLSVVFLPSALSQLALASSPFLEISDLSSRKVQALSKGLNVRDTRSQPHFNKYNDFSPASRYNTSSMEMEIAAIFKEFAYGSSTNSPSTVQTTISTTMTHPTWYKQDTKVKYHNYNYKQESTDKRKFIGVQKEVHNDVKSTTEFFENTTPNTSPTTKHRDYDESELSYLINTSETHTKEDNIEHNKRTSYEDYDSKQKLEENDNQVSISNDFQNGFKTLQEEIGTAWTFHVYSTGISFCLVGVITIISLSRINSCSQLLPRGYFITLHMMIIFASFLRSVSFFHDPYGAYNRLPSVLANLLYNTVNPCIVTGYSVLLLVLLRAARIRLVPLNIQSPLVLATICGIHIGGTVVIDVSSGVLEDNNSVSTLHIIRQSFTVSWGFLLCIGYIVSFTGIEKSANRQQSDLVRLTLPRKGVDDISMSKSSGKSSLTYAARLFLICTLLHGLMIAFVILNIVNTKMSLSPNSSESWAWWTQCTLERIVEIVLCILSLGTAFILTQNQTNNIRKNGDDKLFSIMSNYSGSTSIGNVDVYSISGDKSFLGNRTLPKQVFDCNTANKSHENILIHSPTTDFSKNCPIDHRYTPTPVFLPFGPPPLPSSTLRSSVAKELPVNYNKPFNTLKDYEKIYKSKFNNSVTRTEFQENSIMHRNHHLANTNDYYLNNRFKQEDCNVQPDICNSHPPYYLSAINCTNKQVNDYEVAPYYKSNVSTSTHVYAKPYAYQTNIETHSQHIHQNKQKYKSKNASDFTSVGSSPQSEFRVDYLTDISSSNDGLSTTISNSSTLPVQNMTNISHIPSIDNCVNFVGQHTHFHITDEYCKNEAISNNPLSFLKVSTTSLNEVLKNQTGFITKFVNSTNDTSHYTPLGLDDSISSPSSEYGALKKSISTGDLHDQKLSTSKTGSDSSIYLVNNNKQYSVI